MIVWGTLGLKAKVRLPVNPDLGEIERLAAKLHDSSGAASLPGAQLQVAHAFAFSSWSRLMRAAELCRAIHAEDLDEIARLVSRHPEMLSENLRGEDSNWGPPLSFAANLGRQRAAERLLELGSKDISHACARALFDHPDTAEWLLDHGAEIAPDMVMGACETLSADGIELLLKHGAPLADEKGNRLGPLALLLETYARDPQRKHRSLEVCARNGIDYPDTPVMAFHRGRIDLLKDHFRRDPQLPHRRYPYEDIYPAALGCGEKSTRHGLHGTPLDGTTLLHMAIDFDEVEIAEWLIANGANVNATATLDTDGFGGHTPLFQTVVCQACLFGLQRDAGLTKTLLAAGADPAVRASIRKGMLFAADNSVHECCNVTAAEYGQQFHLKGWVNREAIRLIEAATATRR